MRTAILVAFTVAALALVFQADACADEYVVDNERSEVVVRLFKGGIAAAMGHDHVIRAAEVSGGAIFEAGDLAASSIWMEIPTASLKPDEPHMREKYGLAKRVREKDREKIRATMLSPKQMHVDKYPTILFRSTGIERQSEGLYLITGDLTIHGVTQAVSFPVTVEENDGSFRGIASIDFKQSDFGIKPFSIMLGAIRNRDEAVLHADMTLIPGADAGIED